MEDVMRDVRDNDAGAPLAAYLTGAELERTLVASLAGDVIMIVDRDSTILDINRDLPGLPRKQVLGTPSGSYLGADDRERFNRILQAAFDERRAGRFEHGALSGRTWVARVTPLERDGRVVAAVVVSTEVTRYRETQEMLAAALMRSPLPTLVVDPDGRVLIANEAYCDVTGYGRDELGDIYQAARLLAPDEAALERYLVGIQEVKADAGLTHADEVIRRRNGELLDVQLSISRFSAGFILQLTDITARKAAEKHREEVAQAQLAQSREQLLQAQRLDAVGRLAGGVAHDFNNLLTTVIGHSELLLERLKPSDPNWRGAHRIHRAAKRGATLASQLLAFGRRQMLQRQNLDLNALAAEFANVFRGVLAANIELRLDLEPDLPAVFADESQLEQVLLNLVVNARDALPAGGDIWLRTRCEPDGDDREVVCLRVEDDGAGIAPEHLEHIFEPFYTTREGGAGLGLSVVHGVITQHDGQIRVESTPGDGTRFEVRLPATDPGPPPESVDFVPLDDLKGRSEVVLVVEDEEALRELAATVLTANGYQVMVAGTVMEATKAYQRNAARIDLLFSDVVLPDGTGVDVADRLRQLRPTLPVVLTSGYADQRSQWCRIEAQGYPFLRKPYSTTDLLLILRDAMRGG